MTNNYESLNAITNINQATPSILIRDGVREFYDWALLNIGNYINVDQPSVNAYGGSEHILNNIDDGTTWEAFRGNLVWQSGVTPPAGTDAPLVSTDVDYPGVSGVWVDGDYYPRDTVGTYAHHIDHTNGRVVFDSAISTSSDVTLNYSYKWANIEYVDDKAWFESLYTRSMRLDDGQFGLSASGEYYNDSRSRVDLPLIGIELVGIKDFKPYQLGGGQWLFNEMLFHCVAENRYDRDKLIDIVSLENDKYIYLIDQNRLADDDNFPLDYRGCPVSNALIYPDLIKPSGDSGYRLRTLRLFDFSTEPVYKLNDQLYVGSVKCKTELVLFL